MKCLYRGIALRLLVAACLLAQVLAPSAWAQPVVPPIAPAKPAVQRNPNALVIGTGDLNEALNWARQGNLGDATTSFHLFRDDWQSVADEVRAQSDAVADGVDAAVDGLEALVSAPTPPDQSAYFPLFQQLSDTVEEANNQLNALAPAAGAIRIAPTDLGQSVTWASQGNLAKAHDEFDQFRDDWSLVRDPVRQVAPAIADGIDQATATVTGIISNPNNANPAQTDYYPALQALQRAVLDANRQLALLGATAPAPGTSGPLMIPARDLGEAVNWAGQEDLARARSEFSQFLGTWTTVSPAVHAQSDAVGDSVDAAVTAVQTIIAASAPAKTDYFPALQNLQAVVEAANATLATVPGAASVAAPNAGAPLSIRAGNLGQSVNAAREGDLANAKKEYAEFQDDWGAVKEAVRARSGALTDRIEAANAKAGSELTEDPPTQSQYVDALQTLQQAILDANAQLGN